MVTPIDWCAGMLVVPKPSGAVVDANAGFWEIELAAESKLPTILLTFVSYSSL